MSRSTFNRYTKGKTDVYSTHLIDILSRLHIELSEIQFISNGYSNSEEKDFLIRIKNAFEGKNIDELKYLKTSCETSYIEKSDIFYCHMASLVTVLMNRLNHIDMDITQTDLYKYLISVETWTRYELVLFNNCLFFFNLEAIQVILSRAIASLDKFNDLNPYASESFRLIVNVVITFCKHLDYSETIKYIDLLENYKLREDQLYEQFLLKLFSGIKLLILGDSNGEKNILKCIDFLDFLELDSLKMMCQGLVDAIETNIKRI